MKAGDKVSYVPHECHALDENPAGDYCWVIGRKVMARTGEGIKELVQELHGSQLRDFIDAIRRNPVDRSRMILVRPAIFWPAVVNSANEDGTVNLDINAGRGVTLHYKNIKVDERANTPDTCHADKVEAAKEATEPEAETQTATP